MNRARIPLLIATAMILVASACLVTLPVSAPAPAAPVPVLAQTVVAKTTASTAVLTTARPNPSETPADTMTPFASITPLPSATATGTETPFGFFASLTPMIPTEVITGTGEPPDSAEGATDDWGSNTRCSLISKTPPNWTVVPSLAKYKVSWTLLNSGHRAWQANEMVLTYVDGDRLTSEKNLRLQRDVKVGDTITPVVNIYPPQKPGKYRSVWALRITKTGHLFCTFTIKITVK
jgi:hypothetical protein